MQVTEEQCPRPDLTDQFSEKWIKREMMNGDFMLTFETWMMMSNKRRGWIYNEQELVLRLQHLMGRIILNYIKEPIIGKDYDYHCLQKFIVSP